MIRRRVGAWGTILAGAVAGAWLVASAAAQDEPAAKAPAAATAKAQDAAQGQPAGDAKASQGKGSLLPNGPMAPQPQLSQEQLQAAKAAAGAQAQHPQVDPSTIPPSITNFETEDHGSPYPSTMYLRRFAHSETSSRLPRVAPPPASTFTGIPLMQLHEQLQRSEQEMKARKEDQSETDHSAEMSAAGKSETEYNAPKTAPASGTAAPKAAGTKAKAKPAKADEK